MVAVILILSVFVVISVLFWDLYSLSKNPNNSRVVYKIDWKYRRLCEIRDLYIDGQRMSPPNSYDYFLTQVNATLMKSLSQKPLVDSYERRLEQAKAIAEMLKKESYVRFYFTEYSSFSAEVYHSMCQDYRTGDYLKKDYFTEDRLRKILPVQIVASEKAFSDFMKLVSAGWFDKETGMYVLTEDRKKKHIGRAIKLLCNRSRIPVPERVFSELFNTKEETIKEWTRQDEESNRIDDEIRLILNH